MHDDEDVRRKRNVMVMGSGGRAPATDRQMTGENTKRRVAAEARESER